jgi:hypothetical protein
MPAARMGTLLVMEIASVADPLTIAVGSLVVLSVFVDAAMTTLTVSTAAGPLTRRALPAMSRLRRAS